MEIGGVLQNMLPLLRNALGARNQLIVPQAQKSIYAEIDEVGLESAVLNLVINARDALKNGGIVTMAVNLAVSPEGKPMVSI